MKPLIRLLFLLFISVQGIGQNSLYRSVNANHSNVNFSNDITETEAVNVAMYDYLYNGGGVGVGDFNNDGKSDLFFAGNMSNDRLYLNKGNFEFEDVTIAANIQKGGWSTGVCITDINEDGWDDIYVCRSGWYDNPDSLKNKLYINRQDGTFTEEAEKYGLALSGHHIQAAPLDFDRDGDLDLYVMGHPGSFKHSVDFQTTLERIIAGEVEGDLLLENNNGNFVDVTKKAEITEFGYGLGLAISDINLDGYPDIFIGNDFDEPDHLFINQKNGTFTDKANTYFKHTSNYSMGNDVGDINNDGMQDYISVDMAFESHKRSKMNMASMQPAKFSARVKLGWHHQYMHNMLQLNSGVNNFQEIAHLSGVAKTDWSWAPLFMDINADGYQDLFITNGYKRDTKNNDIQHLINEELKKQKKLTQLEAIKLIPSVKVKNYFFLNNKDLTFTDKRSDWGPNEALNSNGAAYADLDKDGDLDLILNNVDTLASIYENTLNNQHHYLTLNLQTLPIREILGARFILETKNNQQVREAYFVRGYQSTVERKIHFYWNKDDTFERLIVQFANKKRFEIPVKKVDREFSFKLKKLKLTTEESKEKSPWLTETALLHGLSLTYAENESNDYEKESLLPHELSKSGPALAVDDINNDGLSDFILGSSVGRIPYVIIQKEDGHFGKMQVASFFNHQMSEDAGIHIFDVNGDRNKDLLISSGGYQYAQGDSHYVNRLYIGNGQGNFGYVENALPLQNFNSGAVIANDVDLDGDLDFLICGKASAQNYPYPGKTTLLINEQGFFKDYTQQRAPELERVGMVNDAVFSDLNEDGYDDLIIVGEWMDITLFYNDQNGSFKKSTQALNRKGWWSCIEKVDIDGDGDDDFVIGNAGLNNKFQASKEKPLYVYANDFDDNGQNDIVLSYEKSGELLPVRGKECSTDQMPFLAEKFPTYLSFASSTLTDIYGLDKLNEALAYEANEFRSGILYNNGMGRFQFEPLPSQAQFSFINDVLICDINKDGLKDILAVGNRFAVEVETTRYDAGNGICLIQNAQGEFEYCSAVQSGFFVPGEATSIELITLGGDQKTQAILVANNQSRVLLFEWK